MDLLLWRRFRTNDGGRADVAYAGSAQQDLAEAGPILPVGTRVTVEPPDPAAKRAPVRIIRLWSPASGT